jgi:subtilisin family serine protease
MYKYHYSGQENTLVEARDLVVVRTVSGETLQELDMSTDSRDLVPKLLPVVAFPEADVTVYKIVGSTPDKVVSMRNTMRRMLSAEANIRYAGRVLKDPKTGTIYVYTENVFVKFKDGITKAKAKEIIDSVGLSISEELPFAGHAYFAKAPEGTGLEVFEIAENLLQKTEVDSCHPELVGQKKHKAIYPMQWHLDRTQISGRIIDQHVHTRQAWDLTRGAGVTIAVIDDGVDVAHEEFSASGKIIYPRNTIRNIDDASPIYASDNHGTACAGVACANGDKKASGVAPEAKLMPIKFGGLGSISEAKAFAWAADHGADVISCSWGPADGRWWNAGDPLHVTPSPLPDSTRYALAYALEQGRKGKGCVIVWAAGNGNEDVSYDGYASHPDVIAVAACNDRGKRSVYSDFGEAVWCAFPSSDFGYPILDHPYPLTAGIWTVDRVNGAGYNEGGDFSEEWVGDTLGNYTATFGGTSSACPGVAGVTALMLSVNPELTHNEVKEIIKFSCDQIDFEAGDYDHDGHSPFYGYGRINAELAVKNAIAALPGEDEQDLDVKGLAAFHKQGALPFSDGTWVGTEKRQRFLGLQLSIEAFVPGLSLEYRVKLNREPTGPWVEASSFAGTDDRRRKAIGFAIRLRGEKADEYDIVYQAVLRGEKELANGKNGSVCGTFNHRGDAIEAIKVTLKRR